MRWLNKWLGFGLLIPAGALLGQVTVEVTLDQQQFLPGESLPIAVRVTNLSGQPLRLGTDDEWLQIAVEGRAGQIVRRLADPPVRGEFTLQSSQRATKRLDLAPCFDLSRQGRYRVQATVRIAAWDRQFVSEPVTFYIISGSRLWEREFGVPQSATNAAPEVRKYILQQANYLKQELRLYLRLTDATETKIYRVLALGPVVSFGRPEPQLDRHSNLHLLYQRGRTACSYVVVNPDGIVLTRQTYDIAGSRPRLQWNEAGDLVVTGGARRYAEDDYPPRKPDGEAASPSNLAPTNAATPAGAP